MASKIFWENTLFSCCCFLGVFHVDISTECGSRYRVSGSGLCTRSEELGVKAAPCVRGRGWAGWAGCGAKAYLDIYAVDSRKVSMWERAVKGAERNAFLGICPGRCSRARCPLWQRAPGWCYQPGKFNPDAPPQKDKMHPPPVITRSQLETCF